MSSSEAAGNPTTAPKVARRCRKGSRSSFTLVELLVVMGIIALLMVMAMPTFLRGGSSTAAQGAVSRLKATMNLARQWAVTRRTRTYVVFPMHTNSFAGAPHLVSTALRGWNIWTAEEGYLNEWQFLPPGFLFRDDGGSSAPWSENLLSNSTATDRSFPVGFPPGVGSTQFMRCISFRPNGQLNQTGGTTLQVLFSEGSALDNLAAGTVTNILRNPTGRVFGVRIQPLTGRASVVEY